MSVLTTRAALAAAALTALHDAAPEHRRQRRDEWLALATPGEIRRKYRAWMNIIPGGPVL
jgi:hypothetical protein